MINYIHRAIKAIREEFHPTLPSETEHGKRHLAALRETGLLNTTRPGNPVDDIGSAFDLARNYHIELSSGLSYGVCRARLPKEHWAREPLPKYARYIPMGDWIDRGTVQEAVVACILNCYEMGILDVLREEPKP